MRKKYCENAVILTDLAVFAIAFICSLLIRYGGEARHVLFDYNYSQNIGVLFIYLILYLLIIFAVRGTGGYKLGRNIPEQVIYVVRNQGTLLMIIILFAFFTQRGMSFSRIFVAYTFSISAVLDLIARSMLRHNCEKVSRQDMRHRKNSRSSVHSVFTIDEHVVRELYGDELPEPREADLADEGAAGRDGFEKYRHVFAIGCKGIPATYGGFESFMDNLTRNKMSKQLMYHVARISHDTLRFEYNDSVCFDIPVPDIGAAKAIIYDCSALEYSIRYCKRHPEIKNPVFFIMACRIGPVISIYKNRIHKLGGKLYVNPDGHEWKRAKWNRFIKKYWKISERLMVKHADLLICDSRNIEKYMHEMYAEYEPKTTFIPYGSDIKASVLKDDDNDFQRWLRFNRLKPGEYYLVVGRFVPENNFETVIREFMKSDTERKLAIITTENSRFLDELQKKLKFESDKRIRFTGTVYNEELLKKIRENAFAYIHGHEVGGTNPSLLEALSSTNLNLLNEVRFNTEVGADAALYWNKSDKSLHDLIKYVEELDEPEIEEYGNRAKRRIEKEYLWKETCENYERVFREESN